ADAAVTTVPFPGNGRPDRDLAALFSGVLPTSRGWQLPFCEKGCTGRLLTDVPRWVRSLVKVVASACGDPHAAFHPHLGGGN
ncbi:MAG: hypothetical protein QOC63_6061, partial [Mycobacterium sp.]|nr:hypothetical protein [Mycobacterium sp.]